MARNNNFNLIRIIVAGLLMLAASSAAFAKPIPSIPDDRHGINWYPSGAWIQSADCALETGALLVMCRKGKLYPLAEFDAGDDPGHALVLGLYSIITGNHVEPVDILTLNTLINYSGLIILSALLFSLDLKIASLLVLACGAAVAGHYNVMSPHPAQLGGAALSAVLPLTILALLPSIESRRKTVIAWLVAGVICLSAATMFRQAIGQMGVAASVMALAFYATRRHAKYVIAVVLALAVLVSYKSPLMVLKARDYAFDVVPTDQMEQHGIWHNLFIGLGVTKNDFGISWEDMNGLGHAQAVDPNVRWISNEYFAIQRREYFRIVSEHPLAVALIYAEKLQLTLEQKLPLIRIPFGWLLLALTIAASTLRYVKFRGSLFGASDAILTLSAIFVCFFIGQSVLVNFDLKYLFPVMLFLILSGAGILEMANRAWGRSREQKEVTLNAG